MKATVLANYVEQMRRLSERVSNDPEKCHVLADQLLAKVVMELFPKEHLIAELIAAYKDVVG